MIVDAGMRSSGEVRIGFSPAFDKYHESVSTKVESKVQEGGGEFCEQATLKSGGVFGWSNQRRDKEPIMGNLTNFNGISGGDFSNLVDSNEEFQIFETAEVVETVQPCEQGLHAENCGSPNQTRCDSNPRAEPFVPPFDNLDLSENSSCLSDNMSLLDEMEDPVAILTDLKEKNSDRPVIAHLNINSLSSKFEPLVEMVGKNIDFLLVTESKLDDTFPMGQFQIEGFSRPIRL